jgi:hypothetical protein
MYYLGQVLKTEFSNHDDFTHAIGILLAKEFTTPVNRTDEAVYYSVLVYDKVKRGKAKVYLFDEEDMGYAFDAKGGVVYGKTKTNTLCLLDTHLELKDSHYSELKRINNSKLLEINNII